jgi:hypothetical protein
MDADPKSQKNFEKLLQDESSIVVPSPTDAVQSHGEADEQRKLHALTAILLRFKAVLFTPAASDFETQEYEAKIHRVMALTERIRPAPQHESSLRRFLSFDWLTPVWALAGAAILLAAVILTALNPSSASRTSGNPILLVNCISDTSTLGQFPMRGQPPTQIRPMDLTAALLTVLSNQFGSASVSTRTSELSDQPLLSSSAYPEALPHRTRQPFALLLSESPNKERHELLLQLFDTKGKKLISTRRLDATDPANLLTNVITAAESLLVDLKHKTAVP